MKRFEFFDCPFNAHSLAVQNAHLRIGGIQIAAHDQDLAWKSPPAALRRLEESSAQRAFKRRTPSPPELYKFTMR
jgi:hypothetical protein